MFKKAIQHVRKSIFPIFHYGKKGNNYSFGVLGTGFFIDEEGHFLTAAHVLNALPENSNFGYPGNIPNVRKTQASFDPIQVISINNAMDLALAKISVNKLAPLKFSDYKAVVGESVVLCGYPLPLIKPSSLVENADGEKVVRLNLDISSVRQYWQPTVKIDEISKGLLYNKGFQSFITQHSALPGMSGGPIFNIEGEVVGLTSANFTRKVQRNPSLQIDVENGIGVGLNEIKSFLGRNSMQFSSLS